MNGNTKTILAVIFTVCSIVAGAWFIDDRVEAKVRASETRVSHELKCVRDMEKQLSRIEAKLEYIDKRLDKIDNK